MIKKILSLVIFGVLTFGMLFGADVNTKDTFNLQVKIDTIDPQYRLVVTGNSKTVKSDDVDNTIVYDTTTNKFKTNAAGDRTLTVNVLVQQKNFARCKNTIKIEVSATPFTLVNSDSANKPSATYTYTAESNAPTVSNLARGKDDTPALSVTWTNSTASPVKITCAYSKWGFPVLADRDIAKFDLTYTIPSLDETKIPIGGENAYYQSTITLTVTSES